MNIEGQLKEIEQYLHLYEEDINEQMKIFFGKKKKYIVFLSAGFLKKKAIVVQGTGNRLSTSWRNGVNALRKALKGQKVEPKWLKVDLVSSIEKLTLKEFYEDIKKFPRGYYPKGFSFDRMFNIAYLQEEIAANVFLVGVADRKPQLSLENINLYRKNHQRFRYSLTEDHIENIFTFSTISIMLEGKENSYIPANIKLDDIAEEKIIKKIKRTADYLGERISIEGAIYPSFYPAFDRGVRRTRFKEKIKILESLIEANKALADENLKKKVAKGIDYLFQEYEWSFGKWSTLIEVQKHLLFLLLLLKYQSIEEVKEIEYFQDFKRTYLNNQSTIENIFLKTSDFKNDDLPLKLDILLSLFEIDLRIDDQQTRALFMKLSKDFDFEDKRLSSKVELNLLMTHLLGQEPKEEYLSILIENTKAILNNQSLQEIESAKALQVLLLVKRVKQHLAQEVSGINSIISGVELNKYLVEYLNKQEESIFKPELAMYFESPEKIINAYFKRSQLYKVDLGQNANNLKVLIELLNIIHSNDTFKKKENKLKELSKDKVLIGMIRKDEEPPEEALQAALIVSFYEGMELVYFSPSNLQNKVGKIYNGRNWESVKVSSLSILENLEDLPVPKNIKCQQLTFNKKLVEVYQKLNLIDQLKKDMMPLSLVNSKNEIFQNIRTLPSLTLQKDGQVYQYFMKTGQTYLLWDKKRTLQVTEDKLLEEIKFESKEDVYIQQYVQSVTKLGIPFKIKILIGKSHKEYEVMAEYFQLNHVDLFSYTAEITSSLLPLEDMLKIEYPDHKEAVSRNIKRILDDLLREININEYQLPKVFEITLGIDINKKVWIENLFGLSPLVRKKINVQQLVFKEVLDKIKNSRKFLNLKIRN